MKNAFFIFLFIISSMSFAQNNYIVKTDDGRRVLLKADFTWEYIDLEAPKADSLVTETPKAVEKNECHLPENFEEPKLDNQIQNQLKRSNTTIHHVKKKAAKDNDCTVEDVILVSASEKILDGYYDFCIKGKKVSYKRVGNSILKRKKLL